ncbi:hypothetical protein [Nitrosarchaeum sp.]|uniref:hypothetical protein n=1 Tax=Nitrosarchaeum sp. TaxID=2026886 RepID=UPI00247CCE4B|nr:hypothetical protein [Nitrosarchaeum sp.]MCV0411931.1 hypothetical protein [Nitrosarchaeum sp.]
MKSYSKHLSSRLEFGETQESFRKPILRSSGIFPVIKNQYYSSRILFLGYWLIKRDIPEVSIIITLRDNSGSLLSRKTNVISTVQAFSINLDSLLKEIHYIQSDFLGSIELEFNTTRDMVFPYPALVLEYFNEQFSTCVHTIERIYNDFEDLNENEQFKVPESGFDIYCDEDLEPFMAFVNGPLKNNNGCIDYTITTHKSEKFKGSFSLGNIKPYETKLIKFKDHIPKLREILNGNSGSISISHNFEGFFPRLLVGNIQSSFPSLSFTHSYYDCTLCDSETDFWNRINSNFYDSSIYIPLFLKNNLYTELVIYPNFSPSNFDIQIIIYDKNGNELHNFDHFMSFNSKESKLVKINFNKLLTESYIAHNSAVSAHIITKFSSQKIPTRIKFGLDVGISKARSKLPCNICFNAKVGNPSIENKPGSFHWAPIFVNNSIITIGNFSPKKNYNQTANIKMNFYRKKDSSTITKEICLKPNSEYRLNLDDEIKEFLIDDGWITMKADNPFVHGYYFNFHSSGSVAGDHVF